MRPSLALLRHLDHCAQLMQAVDVRIARSPLQHRQAGLPLNRLNGHVHVVHHKGAGGCVESISIIWEEEEDDGSRLKKMRTFLCVLAFAAVAVAFTNDKTVSAGHVCHV